MATYGGGGSKYTSATELLVSGYAMTWAGSPVEKEVVLATAASAVPAGVSLQSCKQNDNIGLSAPGETVKAVAGGTITVGALVTATTGGKFIVATEAAAGATEFAWGVAESAAATGEVFRLRYQPFEFDVA